MTRKWTMLIGTGVGAGLMYLFDPDRGPARRAQLRDRYDSARRAAQQGTGAAQTDLRNRVQGWTAFARSWLSSEREPVGDDTLAARVRAAIGRVSAHPSSIDVSAQNGRAILRGPILAEEVPLVMDSVYGVRGIVAVENQLEVHAAPGDVPALQGGRSRSGFGAKWSPSARVGAGVGGGLLALRGLMRGGLVSRALGFGGFALLTRAATDLDLRRLTGIGARRRGVDIQKTARIQAPVERVFEVWEHCENYPNFMTHVRKVQQLQDGQTPKRWRWTVTGPAGTEFDFETKISAYERNRLIGWRTEPGSLIQHEGQVRFTEEPGGATRADIRMSYNPVAGAVGHAVARLFGADAKRQMDDDVMRMKQYIESSVPARDAAAQSKPQSQTRPSL